VKVKLLLALAGVVVIAAGIVLVLLPQEARIDVDQEDLPTGTPATVIAGALVVVVGLALLVLGITNRASIRLVPAHASALRQFDPVPDPNPVPDANPVPIISSEAEAAVVRLLDRDERLLYVRVRDSGGEALQRDIVAWRTFSPAKVTRLLDRLEAKGLIVRERQGSTNLVRLTRRAGIPSK
jgi:uncharacterized membrane protein